MNNILSIDVYTSPLQTLPESVGGGWFPPTTSTLLTGPTEAVLVDTQYLQNDVSEVIRRWRAWFGERTVDNTVVPEPLTGNTIWIDGRELKVIEIAQADTAPTAIVWAPWLQSLTTISGHRRPTKCLTRATAPASSGDRAVTDLESESPETMSK